MDNQNWQYFLALELRPGDYRLINISALPLKNNYDSNSLEFIDNFTCQYTMEELMLAIKTSNVVPEQYLEGKLSIKGFLKDNLKTPKRHLDVIDKNSTAGFDLVTFISDNISNKEITNHIVNKLIGLKCDVKNIKEGIQEKNAKKVILNIYQIEYFRRRDFIIYLINENKKLKGDSSKIIILKNTAKRKEHTSKVRVLKEAA